MFQHLKSSLVVTRLHKRRKIRQVQRPRRCVMGRRSFGRRLVIGSVRHTGTRQPVRMCSQAHVDALKVASQCKNVFVPTRRQPRTRRQEAVAVRQPNRRNHAITPCDVNEKKSAVSQTPGLTPVQTAGRKRNTRQPILKLIDVVDFPPLNRGEGVLEKEPTPDARQKLAELILLPDPTRLKSIKRHDRELDDARNVVPQHPDGHNVEGRNRH